MIKEETTCIICGETKSRSDFVIRKSGKRKGYLADRVCRNCQFERFLEQVRKYRKHQDYKKDYCEGCGFQGEPVQFDVHHIDGNHYNNSEENLQTLCANCHRLITKENGQGIYGA